MKKINEIKPTIRLFLFYFITFSVGRIGFGDQLEDKVKIQNPNGLLVKCEEISKIPSHTKIFENLEAGMVNTKRADGTTSCPIITLIADFKIDDIKIPKGCQISFGNFNENDNLNQIACFHSEIIDIDGTKFKEEVTFYPNRQVEYGILASTLKIHDITFPTNSYISFYGSSNPNKKIGEPVTGHIGKESKDKIILNGKKIDNVHCYVVDKLSGESKWSPHETTKAEHQQELDNQEKRE